MERREKARTDEIGNAGKRAAERMGDTERTAGRQLSSPDRCDDGESFTGASRSGRTGETGGLSIDRSGETPGGRRLGTTESWTDRGR